MNAQQFKFNIRNFQYLVNNIYKLYRFLDTASKVVFYKSKSFQNDFKTPRLT